MAANGSGGSTTLAPEAAFAVLGNDVRMEILRTLGDADEPIAFADLRGRVGIDDSSRFNYHLGELIGHFVRQTKAGYELRQAGQRAIEAILSGAITKVPNFERTAIDASCQLCGAPIEIRYTEDRVEAFCTECAGVWGPHKQCETGFLGRRLLPPAGIPGRSALEIYQVAWVWTLVEFLLIGQRICPACSARLEYEILLCEDHDPINGFCQGCDRRYAAGINWTCSNCIFVLESTFPVCVSSHTDLLRLLITNGLNPINPDEIALVQGVFSDYEEEITSMDPPEVKLTFSAGRDSVMLRVNDELDVIEVDSRL